MDTLQEAQLCINRAHDEYAEHPTVSALELQFAQAYAAVAQAAALTRIADALEHVNNSGRWMSITQVLYGMVKQNDRE